MDYLGKLYQAQRRLAAPDGPADERRDVSQGVLQQILARVSRADVDAAQDVLTWSKEPRQLAKAKVLAPVVYSSAYPDAYKNRRPRHQAVLYYNELGTFGYQTGEPWADKPSGYGGFEFLKMMAKSLDVVQAIIFTRQRQLTNYWRRYREDDANPLGYRWIREDGERLTKADLKEIDGLDAILQNCGTETDPLKRRWVERRRTFRGFMDALVVDTLTADACPIETVRDYGGRLCGWHNLDFTTMRLAFEDGYQGDDAIVGVQIEPRSRQAIMAFEREELIYETRNPRSAIGLGDYGEAELEHLIRAMTAYLNTCTANAAALDRNTLPRGALVLHGDYNERALLDLQANWNAMMSGAANKFKFPILTSKTKADGGATWINFDSDSNEMLKTKHLIFTMSMACASYGIAPEEINIASFSDKTSSLSGEDTSEKLQSSHDRGLIPLATWCFDSIVNPMLVGQLTEKYRIVSNGLFPADEVRKHERQKLTLTVNDMRAIDGGDPATSDILGNAPVNAALIPLYVQELQQQGVLPPPQAAQDPNAEEQPPGRSQALSHAQIGLTGSEAPLPRPSATRPASRAMGTGGTRPTATPFSGGKDVVAKAKLVATIHALAPDEVWP